MSIRSRIIQFVANTAADLYASKGAVLFGRSSSSGPGQEIELGAGLEFDVDGKLAATGGGTSYAPDINALLAAADNAAALASLGAASAADLTTEESARIAADALLAPKANPVFTGTVTVPDNAFSIAKTDGLAEALTPILRTLAEGPPGGNWMVVSGSSDANFNGVYVATGATGDGIHYLKGDYKIIYNDFGGGSPNYWRIEGTVDDYGYQGSDAATPDLVTTWSSLDDGPAGVIVVSVDTISAARIGQWCRVGDDPGPYTWYRAETLTSWVEDNAGTTDNPTFTGRTTMESARVESLAQGDGYKQVYVNETGDMVAVDPPPVGWTETDTDTGTYAIGGGIGTGAWVEIDGLAILTPEALAENERVDVFGQLGVVNATNRDGGLEIGISTDGGSTITSVEIAAIPANFSAAVQFSGISVVHPAFPPGTAVSVWARSVNGSHAQYAVSVNGTAKQHDLTASVPTAGGGAVTADSVAAVIGDIPDDTIPIAKTIGLAEALATIQRTLAEGAPTEAEANQVTISGDAVGAGRINGVWQHSEGYHNEGRLIFSKNAGFGVQAIYWHADGYWAFGAVAGTPDYKVYVDVPHPGMIPADAVWEHYDEGNKSGITCTTPLNPGSVGRDLMLDTASGGVKDWYKWNGVDWVFVRTDGVSPVTAENIAAVIADDPEAVRAAAQVDIGGRVYASGGSLAGIRTRMQNNRSCGIAICGDSTGNEMDEWPQRFMEWLKTEFPDFGFLHRTWTGTTWTTLDSVAPPLGERHVDFPSDGVRSSDIFDLTLGSELFKLPSASLELAMELKVTVGDFTQVSAYIGQVWAVNAVTNRLCTLSIATGGNAKKPVFSWYNTNGDFKIATASTALPYSDGATFWIRAELVTQVGGDSTTVFKYRALDTDAWVTLGTTITTTTTYAVREVAPTTDSIMVVRASPGLKVYRMRIFDKVDVSYGSLPIAPIDNFDTETILNRAEFGGSPLFVIENQSVPGWGVYQFLPDGGYGSYVPMTKSFYNADVGVGACLLSLSHNCSSAQPYHRNGAFGTGCAQILSDMVARFPVATKIYCIQNPKNEVSTALNQRHAFRGALLIDRARLDRDGVLNIDQAFRESGIPLVELLDIGDTQHPNTVGEQLWADTLVNAWKSNAL